MHLCGKRCGVFLVNVRHDVVRDHNAVGALVYALGEGDKIAGAKLVERPCVVGHVLVGVGVVAVTGEVLEHRAELFALVDIDDLFDEGVHLVDVAAERAVVDERLGVRRDVAHGSVVDVDAERGQKLCLFGLGGFNCLPTAVLIIVFRRVKG